MMPKQDKKKKGGARRGPSSYVKKLKDSEGRIVEKVRHKKGINPSAREVSHRPSPIGAAILNFDSRRVVLECATPFTTLHDGLEFYFPCTKAKEHNGFHGLGNGLDNPDA